MKDWTPKRVSFDPKLTLSRNESFVLSRVDGTLSVSDLVDITGLGAQEIDGILENLVKQGAVNAAPDADDAEGENIPPDPVSWIADQLPGMEADREPSEPELAAIAEPRPRSSAPRELTVVGDEQDLELAGEATKPSETSDDAGDAKKSEAPEDPEEARSPLADAEEGGDERTYRALYEAELRRLSLTERMATARMCTDPTLQALCFDTDPQVIRAIMENDRVNAGHARLIATHHRNPAGLDHVAARVEFLRDTQVQRRLLRNAQLPEALLKRMLMPKRLLEIFKTSNDRDVPDRTRNGAKGLFKAKYAQAAPEEKFELIWNTEGRVLPSLLGQTIDQKTAAMICGRNMTSVMLIQSLARFPATPPSVLAHLLKQPLVKRQAHLRNMLLQHPNVPSEAKRRGGF